LAGWPKLRQLFFFFPVFNPAVGNLAASSFPSFIVFFVSLPSEGLCGCRPLFFVRRKRGVNFSFFFPCAFRQFSPIAYFRRETCFSWRYPACCLFFPPWLGAVFFPFSSLGGNDYCYFSVLFTEFGPTGSNRHATLVSSLGQFVGPPFWASSLLLLFPFFSCFRFFLFSPLLKPWRRGGYFFWQAVFLLLSVYGPNLSDKMLEVDFRFLCSSFFQCFLSSLCCVQMTPSPIDAPFKDAPTLSPFSFFFTALPPRSSTQLE